MQLFERVVKLRRHALATALAHVAAQDLLGLDDLAPVELAGVEQTQHHLADAGQGGQHLQGLLGQRRNAEHHDTRRYFRGAGRLALFDLAGQLLGGPLEALVHGAAVTVALVGRQGVADPAPQCRLPALVIGDLCDTVTGQGEHIVPGLPGGEPVGAIDLVLIEQVSQALGQLVTLALLIVLAQVARQRLEQRVVQGFGQQLHQVPAQATLVPGGGGRHLPRAFHRLDHRAVGLPLKARGQGNVGAEADAVARFALALGDGGLEPLGDTVALHQKKGARQRMQRASSQPLQGQITQILHTVALQDDQARGGGGIGHGEFSVLREGVAARGGDGASLSSTRHGIVGTSRHSLMDAAAGITITG